MSYERKIIQCPACQLPALKSRQSKNGNEMYDHVDSTKRCMKAFTFIRPHVPTLRKNKAYGITR